MTMLILNDVKRKPNAPAELSQKAVKPAEGAKTELESRLLNALRRQRFASPGALAAFTRQDDGEVRDALNELIARNLVKWQDESLGSTGAGYMAVDLVKVQAPGLNDSPGGSGLPAWVNKLDPL